MSAVDPPVTSWSRSRCVIGAGTLRVVRTAMVSVTELALVERGEAGVESGLTYDGITPVRVRVSKRGGRYSVTDDAQAVAAAGVARRGVAYPDRIALGEYSVNVSRQGAVWLPAVSPSDEWLATICALVARGSVTLYERLLELEESA